MTKKIMFAIGLMFTLAFSANASIKKCERLLFGKKSNTQMRQPMVDAIDVFKSSALSPSGNLAAIGTRKGHLVVQNTKTGEDILRINLSPEEEGLSPIRHLEFSRDGKSLLVAVGKHVKLIDITSNKEIFSTQTGKSETITAQFIPQTSRFLTLNYDGTMKSWTIPILEKGIQIGEPKPQGWLKRTKTKISKFIYKTKSKLHFAAVSFDTAPLTREIRETKENRPKPGFVVTVSGDGGSVFAVSKNTGNVYHWSTFSGDLLLHGSNIAKNAIAAAVGHKGKSKLYIARINGHVVKLDLSTWDTVDFITPAALQYNTNRDVGLDDKVQNMILTPDEEILITQHYDGRVMIYSANSGRLLHELTDQKATYRVKQYLESNGTIAASFNRKFLVGSQSGKVKYFNRNKLEKDKKAKDRIENEIEELIPTLDQTYVPKGTKVTTMVLSRDKSHALAVLSNKYIAMWDVASGQMLYRMTGFKGNPVSVMFSHDVSKFIVVTQKATFTVHDIKTGDAEVETTLGENGIKTVVKKNKDTPQVETKLNKTKTSQAINPKIYMFPLSEGKITSVAHNNALGAVIVGTRSGMTHVLEVNSMSDNPKFVSIDLHQSHGAIRSIAGAEDSRNIIIPTVTGYTIIDTIQGFNSRVGNSNDTSGMIYTHAKLGLKEGSIQSALLDSSEKYAIVTAEDSIYITEARSGMMNQVHRPLEGYKIEKTTISSEDSIAYIQNGLVFQKPFLTKDGKVQKSKAEALDWQDLRLDEKALTIRYSEDGTVLAAALSSGRVALWNTKTKKLIRVLRTSKSEHVRAIDLAFTPDGEVLIVANTVNNLVFVDLNDGDIFERRKLTSVPTSMTVLPEGDEIVVGLTNGSVEAVKLGEYTVQATRKSVKDMFPDVDPELAAEADAIE